MELILLRHGKAKDSGSDGDFGRELEEKGIEQAVRAGQLLKAMDRLPELVLASPRLRARQTAEHFCKAAELSAPILEPWLDCGMRPGTAVAELVAYAEFRRIMLVGHEPDFSSLAEWLLGASGRVEVKKGSLIGLAVQPPAGSGELRFSIPPKVMQAMETGW